MRTRVHHYQSFAALILFLFLAFGGREIQAQTDSSCNREGSSRSAQTTQAAKLILTNQTSETLTVYWLDFEGKRQKWFDLSAGQAFEQSTFVGHLWLVTKPNGQCLAIFSAPGNFVIGKPQSPVNTNRPKQPQKQSTALPSTSGSSAESYFAQGNKYREAKNYAAAVEAYKKSISLRQSIGAYGALGLVYLEDLKQYEKALDSGESLLLSQKSLDGFLTGTGGFTLNKGTAQMLYLEINKSKQHTEYICADYFHRQYASRFSFIDG